MCLAHCCLCRGVFLGAEVSARHLGTSADMPGQFGTSAEVSYGHFGTSAEMSWVRTVLGPKCRYTSFTTLTLHRHRLFHVVPNID